MNATKLTKFLDSCASDLLRELDRLNLLQVSVKAAKASLASGVAHECRKKVGRPKKSKLGEVSQCDVISALTAKAGGDFSTASKKAEKALKKASEKAAKKEAAAKLRAEKKAEKELLKQQKKDAKLQAKKERQEKAAAELERKQKEAKALMETLDLPIINTEGEVVGSKVPGFTLANEPTPSQDELKPESESWQVPDDYNPFVHDSRPNETLYIDGEGDVFTRNDLDKELEHIGYYEPSNGMLMPLSDDAYLSDTE